MPSSKAASFTAVVTQLPLLLRLLRVQQKTKLVLHANRHLPWPLPPRPLLHAKPAFRKTSPQQLQRPLLSKKPRLKKHQPLLLKK